MADNVSLLEFVRELLSDAGLRDRFAADPQAALHSLGLDGVDAHDVRDALTLVHDDQKADFSRHYDTGDHLIGGLSAHHAAPEPHGQESAAGYVNRYVTHNFVEDPDTVVDHSTTQQIDTGGGDFDQHVDVHSGTASGDVAVAAFGDLTDSTVATGNGNQIGNGNARGNGNVVGNGNHDTTAFGAGNATGTDVHGDDNRGEGAAFASGGSATVNSSDSPQHDAGNLPGAIRASFEDSSGHSADHSFSTHEYRSAPASFTDDSEHTTSHGFDSESDSQHVDNSVVDSFDLTPPA